MGHSGLSLQHVSHPPPSHDYRYQAPAPLPLTVRTPALRKRARPETASAPPRPRKGRRIIRQAGPAARAPKRPPSDPPPAKRPRPSRNQTTLFFAPPPSPKWSSRRTTRASPQTGSICPPPVAKNHRFRLQSMRCIRLCQFYPAPTPAPVTLACMIAPELPRPKHTVVLITEFSSSSLPGPPCMCAFNSQLSRRLKLLLHVT